MPTFPFSLVRRLTRSPLFAASTVRRRRSRDAFAGDTLEPRVMLAGSPADVVITDAGGQDFSFNSATVASVTVAGSANIGTLSIHGDASDIRINVQEGGFANIVNVFGGSGDETVTVRGGVGQINFDGLAGNDTLATFTTSEVGGIDFVGGRGDDRLVITGFVLNDVRVDGGAGNDRLALSNGADLRGDVVGTLGDGNDRVTIQSGPAGQTVVQDVRLDLADGTNVFDFYTTAQIRGDLRLHGGSGTDLVRFRGGSKIDDVLGDVVIGTLGGNDQVAFVGEVNIGGNFGLDLGENSDKAVFTNTSIAGLQFINLGGAAGGRDSLRLGADRIGGSSVIVSPGDAFIQETAARVIGGDYRVTGGDASLAVSLASGSLIGGDLRIASGAIARVHVIATVQGGDAIIATDRGDDIIRLDGLRVLVGNLAVTTDGGDDLVDLVGAAVAGTVFVDVGLGDDLVLNTELVGSAGQTYRGGAGFDTLTTDANATVTGFESIGH